MNATAHTSSARTTGIATSALYTDEDRRNQLVKEHIGLVYHVAQQLTRVSAADSTLDDRVSAGMLGLLRAAEKFDPDAGYAFSTYAAPTIRGAILDDLRAQDPVTRSTRTKARRVKGAEETLSRTLGRDATASEVAEHLELDVPTLWQWQREISQATPVSLDQPAYDSSATTSETLGDLLVADHDTDAGPDAAIQREQELALVRDAILELTEQQRIVLSLHYYEELTLNQIGEVMGVSESRVSQIRTKAIGELRQRMANLRG